MELATPIRVRESRMNDLHYPDLHIQGFRGIKDLEIPQLGRVTLITGKNNTGKSSVLETLRLHSQNAAPRVLLNILASREEHVRVLDEDERSYDPDYVFHVSSLFHGFPQLSEDFGPIVISAQGKSRLMQLTMQVKWVAETIDSNGNRRLIPGQRSFFEGMEPVPALVAETEEGEQIWTLDNLHRQSRLRRGPVPRPSERSRMPCVFVSPYSGERTGALSHLWREIALTDFEEEVVEALRIIDPGISAVNMVDEESNSRARTAIVRAKNIPRPIPLRSLGDGINRLFAIILSLINSRGGILLVDEIENGLHHSVQLDAWRMIFRLAQELDVQVFATSHSWDAVETFQKAAAEAPRDGALLRLTRRYDRIFPTVFVERELAVATRNNIEVR